MLDVRRIETVPLRANCYVVSAGGGDAVVIDPGGQFELIEAEISAAAVRIRAVLCTHAHYDHIGAAVAVGERHDAPFHLHPDDSDLLRRANLFRAFLDYPEPIPLPSIDTPIEDGASLRFGALKVDVLHTPGHTPGGACFAIADALFTGDTLLREGLGRSDLRGGDADALQSSARRLGDRLDPDTRVYPGHGPPTSLGEALGAAASR